MLQEAMHVAMDQSLVIAVMGVAGSGKTSFIKTVTGRDNIQIGHSLISDTSEIVEYPFSYEGISYTLVDMLGFNHSLVDNKVIAARIEKWFKACSMTSCLDGIIILHDISKPRLEGSATSKNTSFLRDLLQCNPYLSVTLATSFWDQVNSSQGARRERELTQSKTFWANMAATGIEVVRIWPDRSVCLEVLQRVGVKARQAQNTTVFHNQNPIIWRESSEVEDYGVDYARKQDDEMDLSRRQLQECAEAYRREIRDLQAQTEERLRSQEQKRRKGEERERRQDELERQKGWQEREILRMHLKQQQKAQEREEQRSKVITGRMEQEMENLRLREHYHQDTEMRGSHDQEESVRMQKCGRFVRGRIQHYEEVAKRQAKQARRQEDAMREMYGEQKTWRQRILRQQLEHVLTSLDEEQSYLLTLPPWSTSPCPAGILPSQHSRCRRRCDLTEPYNHHDPPLRYQLPRISEYENNYIRGTFRLFSNLPNYPV